MRNQAFSHLLHYRVTTAPALARALPAATTQAITALLRDFQKDGYLVSLEAVDSGIFALTQEGAKEAWHALDRPLPVNFKPQLAPIHLMRAYGMLAFCYLGPIPRRLVLREDLLMTWPTFSACSKKAISFYLEEKDEAEHLGVCYVDSGRDPERIVQGMRTISGCIAACKDAREIQQSTGFGFGIVVAQDSTKRAVQKLFLRDPRYRLPSRPVIVVAPELEKFYPLLNRTKRAAASS